METVDVAIVGGGPAGMAAALEAARHGADVVVFERGVPRNDREELGPDSTDAAGMLDYWIDIMDVDYKEIPDEVILQELDRTDFIGPNESCSLYSTGIDASYPGFGFTFQRARMDDWWRERAESAGAEYHVGAAVSDVQSDLSGDPTHEVTTSDGGVVEADRLILADGPQRQVTMRVLDRLLPDDRKASSILSPPTANHIAYQEYREFPEEAFERDVLKFWWGVMPGETAYPWVFPNDGTVARVGLTMPIGMDLDEVENPEEYALLSSDDERIPSGGTYIRRLLEREYGDEYDIETEFPLVEDRGKNDGTETYPISSTRPIDSPTNAGIAVAGGAMGTTSAFHEGGYHVAIRSGKIAGKLAAERELGSYNDAWKDAIGNEILRNVTFATLVEEYGPADWDRAFKTTDTMLAKKSNAMNIFERTYAAGPAAMKLVWKYRLGKRRYRKNGYVQLQADEYTI